MPESSLARRGCVLIVEDDPNATNIMRDYLSRANFEVRVAANGWEAIKRVRDGSVDAVVSEVTISDMDGASLREKCMLNPDSRDVPFLFLVNPKDTERHVRALRSGVDDCIVKPIDPVVLVARVQAVLERRRAYAEMVRVDPLTRMLNRHTLERELDTELGRVGRYNRFGSALLIDVDHFQEVNQENGVAMGDLLLTCLSGVILTNIRNIDLAGRYRGQEFLLYLPETSMEGAKVLASRMQERLRAIADSVAAVPLTFTCGIASAPEHGVRFSAILENLQETVRAGKLHGAGQIHLCSAGAAVPAN